MVQKHPSKPLLLALTGERSGLLSSIHHGLADVSLKDFYPVLTLDETLTFAISSYHDRVLSEGDIDYSEKIQKMGRKELFDYFLSHEIRPRREGNYPTPLGAVSSPYAWLKSHSNLSERHKKQYNRMNEVDDCLEGRLNQISPDSVQKLKDEVCTRPNIYIFDCEYTDRKSELGTNYGLQIMNFQNHFPKKGKIAPEYAAEIARILKTYPEELPQVIPEEESFLDLYNKDLAKVPVEIQEYAEQCGINPIHAGYYDLSGLPEETSQNN